MVICYVLQASPIFGDQSPFEALFAFLQKQNICPKLTKKQPYCWWLMNPANQLRER